MRDRRLMTFSMLFSLTAHVLFLGMSVLWRFQGAQEIREETYKMFDVKKIELPPAALSERQFIKDTGDLIKFEAPSLPKGLGPAKRNLDSKIEAPTPALLPTVAPAKTSGVAGTQNAALPPSDLILLKQRPDKIQRTVQKATPELDVFRSSETEQRATAKDIEIPDAFEEAMFAFTPGKVTGLAEGGIAGAADRPGSANGNGLSGLLGGGRYGSFDEFVDMRLTVYRNPETGQGYYRVAVTPLEVASKLPVLPKELIILMDASLSIQPDRLDRFVDGVRYSIRNLNPEDRFNVYTFKDRITPLSETSLTAEDANADKAVRFLGRLEPSERTDIYEAFLESIETKASLYPSYIMFLSDGRPTFGVTSSEKLIGEITRINNLSRSIFAFSGGARVNRYLLDFLSYQNRGWSEYAAKKHQIDTRIQELYDKIRNPLLTHVRLQMQGLDQQEVYPKNLPDLFLNAEFVVYGTFKDEEEFSIRMTGEARSKNHEFIFRKKFSEAEQGTADIELYWAFNKFYHYISRINLEGRDDEIISQLDYLRKKYGIRSPYEY